jgi:hypothetical protein
MKADWFPNMQKLGSMASQVTAAPLTVLAQGMARGFGTDSHRDGNGGDWKNLCHPLIDFVSPLGQLLAPTVIM